MSNNIQDVIIYGGGMAGALLAKALVRRFRVTLVDPNDYFEVPMSAPRSLLRPELTDDSIIPFSTALPGVDFIRGRLGELRPDGGLIRLPDDREVLLQSRVSVLATGSIFSNSLLRAIDGASVAERKGFYARYRQRIAESKNILIVGGGPIGVELAGEIIEYYPQKNVTILEGGARLLAGASEAASAHATKVLRAGHVTILTNERLESAGSTSMEVFAGAGEALTSRGQRIAYDLLIWCVGGKPNTAYMKPRFAHALNAHGQIRVTPQLRVADCESVFALGDITDIDENKMALHIAGQVKIATHNITTVLTDSPQSAALKAYKSQTGNPMMAVTLGSRNGVLQLPVIGVVRSACINQIVKSRHLLVPKYRKALGV